MFSFRACFWRNDVYINGKYKYAANEILTAYLNNHDLLENTKDPDFCIDVLDAPLREDDSIQDDADTLDLLLYHLQSLKRMLLLSEGMDYKRYTSYNGNVYAAIRIFTMLNGLMDTLPPYNQMQPRPIKTFDELLNEHRRFFDDGRDSNDESPITFDTITPVGFGDQDDVGRFFVRLTKFIPLEPEAIDFYLSSRDFLQDFSNLNQAISDFFDNYISFVRSFIAVHTVFKPFISGYLHKGNSFPDPNDVARQFEAFGKSKRRGFQALTCKMQSFGYKVLTDEQSKPILCEEISFEDLTSFLFYDFFNGIKHNYLPNECRQCGRFFLIRAGKYYSYCDSPLPEEPDKTCRDVGARKRYDEKCKTDPVWQTYNRAYKAHYARYMKKKMTVAEFEEWSRFASELRDKAIAEKIPYEEYYKEIRK